MSGLNRCKVTINLWKIKLKRRKLNGADVERAQADRAPIPKSTQSRCAFLMMWPPFLTVRSTARSSLSRPSGSTTRNNNARDRNQAGRVTASLCFVKHLKSHPHPPFVCEPHVFAPDFFFKMFYYCLTCYCVGFRLTEIITASFHNSVSKAFWKVRQSFPTKTIVYKKTEFFIYFT